MNMRNEEFCCSKKGHYTAFCYLSYPSEPLVFFSPTLRLLSL